MWPFVMNGATENSCEFHEPFVNVMTDDVSHQFQASFILKKFVLIINTFKVLPDYSKFVLFPLKHYGSYGFPFQ